MQTGRLVFFLVPKQGEKSPFKRDKNDLWVLGHKIPIYNALTSYSFELTHLDGRKVALTTKGVVQPNAVMKVPGLGMPIKSNPGQFGDLYIAFKVILPETPLTPAQAVEVSKILTPAPTLTFEEPPLELEIVDHPEEDDYEDEDEFGLGHGHSHGHAHDEGEGEGEGAHEDGSHEDGEEGEEYEEPGQPGCATQ